VIGGSHYQLVISLQVSSGDATLYFAEQNYPTSFSASQTAQIEKVVDGVEYEYLFSSVSANTQYYVGVENLDGDTVGIELNFADVSDLEEDRGSCGPSDTASIFMIVLSVILLVISCVAFAFTFRWRLIETNNVTDVCGVVCVLE
jgi:hypothetical protein